MHTDGAIHTGRHTYIHTEAPYRGACILIDIQSAIMGGQVGIQAGIHTYIHDQLNI